MGARVLDGLKAQQITWAPLSPNEADTLIEICTGEADSLNVAYQVLCAYLFLAARRNSDTATTIATNEEVARHIPRIRGSGTIQEGHYRKSVKQRMKKWGLVDYEPEKYGSGKATEYRFPILEGLMTDGGKPSTLELTEHDKFQGANESLIPGTLELTEHDKHRAPWKQPSTSNAYHKIQERKSSGMEEGHSYYLEEPSYPLPAQPQPQPQPQKQATDRRQAYCNKCRKLVHVSPYQDPSTLQDVARCPKCKSLMFADEA